MLSFSKEEESSHGHHHHGHSLSPSGIPASISSRSHGFLHAFASPGLAWPVSFLPDFLALAFKRRTTGTPRIRQISTVAASPGAAGRRRGTPPVKPAVPPVKIAPGSAFRTNTVRSRFPHRVSRRETASPSGGSLLRPAEMPLSRRRRGRPCRRAIEAAGDETEKLLLRQPLEEPGEQPWVGAPALFICGEEGSCRPVEAELRGGPRGAADTSGARPPLR